MWDDSHREPFGVVHEGRTRKAYNEAAFRYFLAVERTRAQRAGRPFLLLLANLKQVNGAGKRIEPGVAVKLFAGLWLCIRETDFVGWYKDSRVAGAVLAERDASSDVAGIVARVGGVLRNRLPSQVADRLRVRVLRVRPKLRS